MRNKDKYIIMCIYVLLLIVYPFKIIATERFTDNTLTSEKNTSYFNIQLTEEEIKIVEEG